MTTTKRRWPRRLAITAAAVIGSLLLLAGGGAIAFSVATASPTITSIDEARAGRWNTIRPGGETGSSDGSDYYFFVRPGDPEKLMVFFSGGGANWNAVTASAPITIPRILFGGGDYGFYFDSIPTYKLLTLGGILSDDARNPFADWTIVYAPYSTGDFHLGDSTITYQTENGPVTVRHNGQANVRATLDWTYDNVASPSTVLVAGESAGGFAAGFWAGDVLDNYPDATATLYADSSFLETDRWPSIIDDVWQADAEAAFGITPAADIIGAALTAQAQAHPELRILQSHTPRDGTLMRFNAELEGRALDDDYRRRWAQRLNASMDRLSGSLPNYAAFVSDFGAQPDGTTQHTLSPMESFFTAEDGGVTLAQWLSTEAQRH